MKEISTATQRAKTRTIAAYKAHITRQKLIIAAAQKSIKQIKVKMAKLD